MTNGMKSGAGSDPFTDDTDDDGDAESMDTQQENTAQTSPATHTESKPTDEDSAQNTPEQEESPADDSLPYIFDREGVKDDRDIVQYFLRSETVDLEKQAQRTIEQELGTDIYLTDVREALVRVGARHLDEATDELREWGYRFKEE